MESIRLKKRAPTVKSRRRFARLTCAAIGLGMTASLVGGAMTTAPAQANVAASSILAAGQTLVAGQSLQSPNGQFTLVMQGDGNLVEYAGGTTALWNSGTSGHPGAYLAMQSDANAVVYSATNSPLWFSGGGQPTAGYFLQLQSDANLVVYAPSGAAVWANYASIVPQTVKNEISYWLSHVTERWGESHNGFEEVGTDFGMPVDTPIYAVESGPVLGVGYYGGGGVVSVKAAATISEYYQHL